MSLDNSLDNSPQAATLSDVPSYPDVPTYLNILGNLHIWEGDGWKKESMAWKTGAYIASNLSGMPEFTFRGPNARALLSKLSINNVEKWPIGKSKHLVMLDENGYIANHGLTVRDSEESYRHFAAMPWALFKAPELGFDVDIAMRDIFIFQVAGPSSLDILEKLTGGSLRSLAFLGIQNIQIPGVDPSVTIELSRIGMSGTLAYEVRGALEHGPAVFDAVYRAGADFGIQRLGWRTYVVNHTEGGFPQQGCTFLPAAFADAAFVSHPLFGAALPPHQTSGPFSGSTDPYDITARLRTPFEVNWGWMAKFDHDFIGRAALEAEAAAPRRKTVVLRWNKEDVLDVFSSQFEPGEEYRNFEFPTTPQSPAGDHADKVTLGDKQIGVSSLAVYSYYYREMLSHSTIDVELAEIGTEVELHWGNAGGRVKRIRATVERYPYLDLPANKDIDLASSPS